MPTIILPYTPAQLLIAASKKAIDYMRLTCSCNRSSRVCIAREPSVVCSVANADKPGPTTIYTVSARSIASDRLDSVLQVECERFPHTLAVMELDRAAFAGIKELEIDKSTFDHIFRFLDATAKVDHDFSKSWWDGATSKGFREGLSESGRLLFS